MQDVFQTSYVHLIHVLCLGWKHKQQKDINRDLNVIYS